MKKSSDFKKNLVFDNLPQKVLIFFDKIVLFNLKYVIHRE